MPSFRFPALPAVLLAGLATFSLVAQPDGPPPAGFGFPGGPGAFGPPMGMGQETKLVARFDTNGDKRLDAAERAAAREYHLANRANRGGRGGGFGGPGGRDPGRNLAPATPGEMIAPADVKPVAADVPLFDATVLRTVFLTFESPGWEKELEDFNNTDVEVPATLVVDGRTYRDVGVHFRGASSFMMVPAGSKRSLNLSLDFVHPDQNLLGQRTLNLLNANDDPSFLHSALYSHVARQYLAAPQVAFVRVVINGENWGVYPLAEQFNKDFVKSRYNTVKGARWKVGGSPNGRGGFTYLGEDLVAYKRAYEIKTKDDAASWEKLIRVCRLLDQTPADQLETALAPHLDIDTALRFLALDVVFANADGFWTRASDYSIAEDAQGRLRVIPHDMNETFSFGGGRGGFPGARGGPDGRQGPDGRVADERGGPRPDRDGNAGGPASPGAPAFGPGGGSRGGFGGPPGGGRGGPELDPFAAEKNPNATLAQKLLAVPALRVRYATYVREIASTWLDWQRLGPVAGAMHDLIAPEIARDTKKLVTTEAFAASLSGDARSLKNFADQRRAFLLAHPEIAAVARTP
jgi:spore coat protein CotH